MKTWILESKFNILSIKIWKLMFGITIQRSFCALNLKIWILESKFIFPKGRKLNVEWNIQFSIFLMKFSDEICLQMALFNIQYRGKSIGRNMHPPYGACMFGSIIFNWIKNYNSWFLAGTNLSMNTTIESNCSVSVINIIVNPWYCAPNLFLCSEILNDHRHSIFNINLGVKN